MTDKKRLSELSISTVNTNRQAETPFEYLTSNLKRVAEKFATKLGKKPEEVTFDDVSKFIHETDEED